MKPKIYGRSPRDWGLREENLVRLPSSKDEDWKYLKLKGLKDIVFEGAAKPLGPFMSDALVRVSLEGPKVALINGRLDSKRSRLKNLPMGLSVQSVKREKREKQEVEGEIRDGYEALHEALWEEGIRIEVKGVIEEPLHIAVLDWVEPEQKWVMHPHIEIVLYPKAELSVVETYFSAESRGLSLVNGVTKIEIGRGGKLTHYRIQDQNLESYHLSHVDVQVGAEGRYRGDVFSLGALLSRVEISVLLEAEGAETQLNGLYVLKDHQVMDHHTSMDHRAGHTMSRQWYKGILSERSHGIFNGKVYVREGAQKVDSIQNNKNLLLSKEAEIDTKPQLEIWADDVKCSHGATVGQLDPEMLFYLRQRGIDREEAQKMLVRGFMGDLIDKVGIKDLREWLNLRFSTSL